MISELRHVLAALVPHLKAHRSLVAASVLVTGVIVLVDLVNPLLYRALFDVGIATASYALVVELLALMLAVALLRSLLGSVESYARAKVGDSIARSYRQQLFEHALHLTMPVLDNTSSTQLAYRITRECGRIGQVYVSDRLIPAVADVVRLLAFAATLLILDWRVGLVAIATFPATLLATRSISQQAKSLDKQLAILLERGERFLQETLSTVREVRAVGAETRESRRWDEWLRDHWRVNSRANVLHQFVIDSLYRLIDGFGLSLVYGYGAWQVLSGQLTVGGLVASAAYALQIYGTLRRVINVQLETGPTDNALRAVGEVLVQPREWPDVGRIRLERCVGRVEFEKVTFTYPGSTSGIKDVSFDLEPGMFLGVVGPSGSGKSTIVDLCVRFYEPDAGRILVDGKDIAAVPSHDLRRQIGLVSQDIGLWNASIRENLLYGLDRSLAWDAVVRLCKRTLVDDFVRLLPDRYETLVGPRGAKLSGGEKQRIAITRVLLRDPSIVLLDEATAALDSIAEGVLTGLLAELAGGKTRIVVAHRLSTVMAADRIIVIDGGRVVQSGSPSVLREEGLFRQLYETQRLT